MDIYTAQQVKLKNKRKVYFYNYFKDTVSFIILNIIFITNFFYAM